MQCPVLSLRQIGVLGGRTSAPFFIWISGRRRRKLMNSHLIQLFMLFGWGNAGRSSVGKSNISWFYSIECRLFVCVADANVEPNLECSVCMPPPRGPQRNNGPRAPHVRTHPPHDTPSYAVTPRGTRHVHRGAVACMIPVYANTHANTHAYTHTCIP